MTKKTSSFLFLAICCALAILLVEELIGGLTAGCIFAASLVFTGLLSRGFTTAKP
ncbi:MAG: hypothetical protein KDC45_10305 [Bacteroidetes bacterium]|nr:hypothetical protein [Bacteroidota bacterium]